MGDALRFGQSIFFRPQRFLHGGLADHPSHGAPEPVQHGIFIGLDRMLGEQGQNAQGFSSRRSQLVSRERLQSQLAGPGLIVNIRIVPHVVADELGIFARCHAPDLVTPEWNTPVARPVDVRVAAGTRQQMQTPLAAPADVRSLADLRVRAAPFAQISGPDQPDAAEIGVEQAHDGVGDLPEFVFERGRAQQRMLKAVDAPLPHQRLGDALLGLPALGDVQQGGANAGCLARRVAHQAVVELEPQLAAVTPEVTALVRRQSLFPGQLPANGRAAGFPVRLGDELPHRPA